MIRSSKRVLAFGLLTVVAGCAEPPVPPTVVPPPHGPTACDAGPVQGYIGHLNSSFTLSEIRTQSNSQTVRALTPDMAATTDFRPDRVNVYLDASNTVRRITCG